MIAGGGTGGHIFPGVAIADAIERLAPEAEVFFMGRRGSIEERAVSRTGRSFVPIPAMGLARGLEARNAAVPFVVAAGYLRALASLAVRTPHAAVGTGGFISVPPILAARTLRVPVVLQEQNSWPGLATRILSRLASEVHVSFEETGRRLPHARRVVLSGNPVRADLAHRVARQPHAARVRRPGRRSGSRTPGASSLPSAGAVERGRSTRRSRARWRSSRGRGRP